MMEECPPLRGEADLESEAETWRHLDSPNGGLQAVPQKCDPNSAEKQ